MSFERGMTFCTIGSAVLLTWAVHWARHTPVAFCPLLWPAMACGHTSSTSDDTKAYSFRQLKYTWVLPWPVLTYSIVFAGPLEQCIWRCRPDKSLSPVPAAQKNVFEHLLLPGSQPWFGPVSPALLNRRCKRKGERKGQYKGKCSHTEQRKEVERSRVGGSH